MRSWSAPLCLVLLMSYVNVSAQELTIYTLPSPKGINWKSPRRLVLSYIRNAMAPGHDKQPKHSLGHVIIELKDSNHYALVGSTAMSSSYMTHKVMHRGWAAGVLFATVDGKIEEADINAPELAIRMQTGEMAFIHYKVNQVVFDRLWQYLQEYIDKGYGKYYNGKNDPRSGRGAGCSAFAYSFIEIGGLNGLVDESGWQVHIPIQESLIGGPEADDRRVSILKLFLTGKWANIKRRPYRELNLYEPTYIYKQINRQWASARDTGSLHRVLYGKAHGLYIDATNMPVPNEPVWLNGPAVQ